MKGRIDSRPSGLNGDTTERVRPEFVIVGRIRKPHGLSGDLLMEVHTDFPERLRSGVTVYLGQDHRPKVILTCRPHSDKLLIAFEGHEDLEAVQDFRNQPVFVRTDDRPTLSEGEYYHHQILGLKVKTTDDVQLGKIVQILETGANDVYIVRSDSGSEILIPAIQDVIQAIDLEVNEITIDLLPGLIPE